MLINGTSLHWPHSFETGSKLKYSLLHFLRNNGALPNPLYPPLKVLNDGIWLTSPFVYFNCFCLPEVSIKWITTGKISVANQVFR